MKLTSKFKLPSNFSDGMIIRQGAETSLWPGNVYVVEKNGKIVIEGVYDFERAFWGNPMADFNGMNMIAPDHHREPVIWRAYQAQMGTSR